MKGYSSGMRDKRIDIYMRKPAGIGRFGKDSSGLSWEKTCTVWASVSWAKGMRALSEGAVDAYAVAMVRMNYTNLIDMRSRIVYDGDTYQILPETFHSDRQAGTIQFTAQVIIDGPKK